MADQASADKETLLQLSTLVLGSSELLRHTLHCDVEKNMGKLYKIVSQPVIAHQLIEDVPLNWTRISNDKYNAILSYYKARTP